MIVPKMTNREISNELYKDLPAIERKAKYFLEDARSSIRRMVIKNKTFPVNKIMEYTSPRKNTWLIIIKVLSKKNTSISIINYHYNDIGLRAAVLMNNKVVFYNGHLFTRFAERFAERNGLECTSPLDKLKSYFTLNGEVLLTANSKLDNENNVYGTISTGSVLGKIEDGFIIWNTYLSENLLRDNQIEKSKNINDNVNNLQCIIINPEFNIVPGGKFN